MAQSSIIIMKPQIVFSHVSVLTKTSITRGYRRRRCVSRHLHGTNKYVINLSAFQPQIHSRKENLSCSQLIGLPGIEGGSGLYVHRSCHATRPASGSENRSRRSSAVPIRGHMQTGVEARFLCLNQRECHLRLLLSCCYL